jgi:hypothetical protein
MTSFERAACRILGVILFGVLIILYLQMLGCTNTPSGAIDLSPKNKAGQTGYELKGFHGKVHRYKKDIGSIPLSSFPMSNRYLTQYCLNHYMTECISLRITNINKERKSYYIINDCRGRKRNG